MDRASPCSSPRAQGASPTRFFAVLLAFSASVLCSGSLYAQSPEEAAHAWQRSRVNLGAGVGLGWGPFATDSGPWLEAFGVVEAPVWRRFYLRGEPALAAGWLSSSQFLQRGFDSATNSSLISKNDESLHVYGVLGRGLLGVDLTDWVTVRLGGVGGYLAGQFESSVCPNESYGRGQYGGTIQAAVRVGARRRVELAVQGEVLGKFANPRCRPIPDPSLPLQQRYTSVYLSVNEPSRGSLAFLSAKLSYVWF